MNADEFMRELERLHACNEAVRWAAGKTAQEAWETCTIANWMRWWMHRVLEKNLGANGFWRLERCPVCESNDVSCERIRAAHPQIPLTADVMFGSVATGLAPQPENR